MFFDEIGNLSLANHAKLLHALERRQVTPLGADKPEAVDVRIVSATNLAESALCADARGHELAERPSSRCRAPRKFCAAI